MTTDWMTDDPASLLDRLTYHDVAKTIDHSPLRPALGDRFIADKLRLAVAYDVASVTVRPVDVVRAAKLVAGSDVKVGTVVGFPHGNVLTETKGVETARPLAAGGRALG